MIIIFSDGLITALFPVNNKQERGRVFLSEKIFAKRSVTAFFTVMLFLLSCILRVAVVATDESLTAAQESQSRYKIKIGIKRGSVYDRNRVLLTNNKTKILAAVSPTPQAVSKLSSVLKGEELKSALEKLKKNKPVLLEVPKDISADGIKCFTVSLNDPDNSYFEHIIGYTDSSGHGACGIEAAYDDILYSSEEQSAIFYLNGKGEVLKGIEPEFENTEKVSNNVVTTFDLNIQKIAEMAAKSIEKGAVVISEAATGEIVAMLSKPAFNTANLQDYLKSEDAPLLNRALASFSVGSVFKPCVAAAAFSKNKQNFSYTCTGKTRIVDRDFNCHKADGHGLMDLKSALTFSCNTFFYNLGQELGSKAIYDMASSLNFGREIKIADNIFTTPGTMPDLKSLENPALLANFSIGQGYFLLSPVSMLTLYSAIANSGSYNIPHIIKSTTKNGTITEYEKLNPTRVMSEKTADILKEYLSSVIDEGTGEAAKPQLCTAAGKTATAQTGRYFKNGKEINNSWFCGFFPLEKPKYVVIILSEGGTTKQTAGAFAEIADGITRLETDS